MENAGVCMLEPFKGCWRLLKDAVVFKGSCWCLLEEAGAFKESWCLLEEAGAFKGSWYPLEEAGAYVCQNLQEKE